MNFSLDIALVIILLINSLRVMYKGFVAEVMGLAALIGALLAASLLTGPANQLLLQYMPPTTAQALVIFLVIFILVYLLIKVLEKAMHDFLENLSLDKLDNVLGFGLGLLEGVIFVLIISYILLIQNFFDVGQLFSQSQSGKYIQQILHYVMNLQGSVNV